MGFDLPPILPYLLQRLPRLVAPLALVFAVKRTVEPEVLHLPGILWAVVYAASLPLALTVGVLWKDWTDRREAERLGAVMPTRVRDSKPGGLTLLKTMVKNFKTGYIGDMFVDWAVDYGYTFNVKILWENRVFTAEPEYLKIILATQFEAYEKGPAFFRQMEHLLGTGVFNSDGDMWKFHRSMTRPFFSKDRISHFELFERIADDAIAQLKARLKEGYAVDAQDVAYRFTLDSATEFLFGQNVHSLSAGLPYPHDHPHAKDGADHPANAFAHAFSEAQSESAFRSRYGVNWPLLEPFRSRTAPHMRVVRAFIDPILAEAVAKKRAADAASGKGVDAEKGEREVKDGETLLDHLVNYTDDQSVLRDETLNIMIAGRDTTATTISFAIYLLAEHPHVLKRLREEILAKVGPSRRPTYEDMREMKYLRAVINEVLRLYTPVPLNVRTSRKATLWPSKTGGKPIYVPAGTKIPYSPFIMHRRTDLWGPDALEFDPDRFIDERLHKYLTPNPFIFLPFNAGPRICLGQQFAYHESSFFLIRLLQNFDKIALVPEAQPPETRAPSEWSSAQGRKGKEKIWPRGHLTIYAQVSVVLPLGFLSRWFS
ncbi:hypothetical protein HGRIS_009101 [Hohenbuehelia grisea]|uniref:Cytochrome P450 n=1 Tax=Hohenbuehelia grisea TaxID=104357 RepID=A0ABR3J0A5_9AGAR